MAEFLRIPSDHLTLSLPLTKPDDSPRYLRLTQPDLYTTRSRISRLSRENRFEAEKSGEEVLKAVARIDARWCAMKRAPKMPGTDKGSTEERSILWNLFPPPPRGILKTIRC
ncbi:hypothetical protein DBV15_03872 [Temnothorax longispinosus]|uniref:Uncharacterized protein n=1 Tax=Temnothorax longispinosus TaxID=300112 RepID=A0A4S2JQ27_9HYME|nr:hypothetical protein DBV15_03872 [Temnothorax longispinosus]